ncbi:MAG: hypothetical protein HUJ74_02900 [Lachnospiraceae bacterium]|nr:hypothetical protein [Lachnospiraceae bacterium]
MHDIVKALENMMSRVPGFLVKDMELEVLYNTGAYRFYFIPDWHEKG